MKVSAPKKSDFGEYVTLVPLTVTVPNFGAPTIAMPEMAEPLMNGAKSSDVGVFSGKMKFTVAPVGASEETVMVTSAGIEVPPGPVAV